MYTPLNYEALNQFESSYIPSTVHTTNDATVCFFERYMFYRLFSIFDWKLPDGWDLEYLWYVLFESGYAVVIDTKDFGIIPQACTLSGYNIFYHPTEFTTITPEASLIHQGRLGVDGELIRLTPDFRGMRDVIHYFAEKQALISTALDMNLMTSRVAFILAAKNKASAGSLKKLVDKVMQGDIAVAIDEAIIKNDQGQDSIWEFNRDIKTSFIVPELLEATREIDRIFDEYIGIPSVGTEKKERLTNDEVNANNQGTRAIAEVLLDMLHNSIDKVKKLYPALEGNIDVEYAYKDEEDVDIADETYADRNV